MSRFGLDLQSAGSHDIRRIIRDLKRNRRTATCDCAARLWTSSGEEYDATYDCDATYDVWVRMNKRRRRRRGLDSSDRADEDGVGIGLQTNRALTGRLGLGSLMARFELANNRARTELELGFWARLIIEPSPSPTEFGSGSARARTEPPPPSPTSLHPPPPTSLHPPPPTQPLPRPDPSPTATQPPPRPSRDPASIPTQPRPSLHPNPAATQPPPRPRRLDPALHPDPGDRDPASSPPRPTLQPLRDPARADPAPARPPSTTQPLRDGDPDAAPIPSATPAASAIPERHLPRVQRDPPTEIPAAAAQPRRNPHLSPPPMAANPVRLGSTVRTEPNRAEPYRATNRAPSLL